MFGSAHDNILAFRLRSATQEVWMMGDVLWLGRATKALSISAL
jgi:hypothetical protein